MAVVLAGEERPDRGPTRFVRISVLSRTAKGSPAFFVPGTALRSLGARAASRATVSVTYDQAVAVPTPNPAATSANGSPLRRCARTSRLRQDEGQQGAEAGYPAVRSRVQRSPSEDCRMGKRNTPMNAPSFPTPAEIPLTCPAGPAVTPTARPGREETS